MGDGGDGYNYDQADWGDAALTDAAGHRTYLSDAANTQALGAVFLSQGTLPASFTYARPVIGNPAADMATRGTDTRDAR